MVPLSPAWAEDSVSPPAIVQPGVATTQVNSPPPEPQAASEESTPLPEAPVEADPQPVPPPERPIADESVNLPSKFSASEQPKQSQGSPANQINQEATPQPVLVAPTLLPFPGAADGSSPIAKPEVKKSLAVQPIAPPPQRRATPSRSVQSVESIPFVPEPVGVLPQSFASFCAATLQPQSGKPNFLSPPTRKPQGSPISLRSLKGTPVDCTTGGKMVLPLASAAPITSGFGWRIHPIMGTRRFHAGIDFAAPYGSIVRAAHSGIVVAAGNAGDGYGGKIMIAAPNGVRRTLYGHLSSLGVRPGQRVVGGQPIGRVGSTGLSTGPHLHFETQLLTAAGWQAVNPLP